ncbi:MAG: ABC transporter permease [Acidimicrobiia bacterium]|nr:ABC transporter permease [Acidimicrobiia bacterium]
MTLARQLALRLGLFILLLLAVSMITFGAMNLLGDPLFNILGPISGCEDAISESGESVTVESSDGLAQNCGPDQIQAVQDAKEQYYLDKSLPERYVRWLGDAVQGDFGTSFANQGESVTNIVRDKLPVSLLLMVMAQTIAVVIAIPWGVWAASRAGKASDRVSTIGSFGLVSMPNFALGIILYYVLIVRLGWFPFRYEDDDLWSRINSLFVPAITLALPISAVYQRLLRTDLITTLQDDFILMARSKGVPRRSVLFKHALRPSMFSFITVFGINAGALIGGTLVIERIFQIPGAGSEIVTAVFREDFPVVLAFVVIITAGFVLLNILVDLLYSILDPRVRT